MTVKELKSMSLADEAEYMDEEEELEEDEFENEEENEEYEEDEFGYPAEDDSEME